MIRFQLPRMESPSGTHTRELAGSGAQSAVSTFPDEITIRNAALTTSAYIQNEFQLPRMK